MNKRSTATLVMVGYFAVLIKIMVFKDMPTIRVGGMMIKFSGTQAGPPNLIPFTTIWRYLLGENGLMIGGINIIGNVVLLVPIGFLIPFVFHGITWKRAVAFAMIAGFMIEGMQGLLRVGIFDIDDVILNALGVIIGYWACISLRNWWLSRNMKRQK